MTRVEEEEEQQQQQTLLETERHSLANDKHMHARVHHDQRVLKLSHFYQHSKTLHLDDQNINTVKLHSSTT